mmetsp:Transcript_2454/g.296  ORF Transcript_2454/g.296 Transcript_2454/m.296 type:complete len:80 (+) Transcript_2454:135-374(+)
MLCRDTKVQHGKQKLNRDSMSMHMFTQISFLKQFPGNLALKGFITTVFAAELNVTRFFILELSFIVSSKLQDYEAGRKI